MYTLNSTVHKYLSNEEGGDREHRPLKRTDSSTARSHDPLFLCYAPLHFTVTQPQYNSLVISACSQKEAIELHSRLRNTRNTHHTIKTMHYVVRIFLSVLH